MRPLLLVLSALAAVSVADDDNLLGGRKCTYGPRYWCRDLRTSAECGATRHCAERHWPQLARTLDPDDDDVCTICKIMV